jgi:hypothetical protein
VDQGYYPTKHSGCEPIHPVKNWCKVRAIIRAARRGENIPSILIDGDVGNGSLLTGTHRAAANDIMLMLSERNCSDLDTIPFISYVALDDVDDDDLRDQMADAIDDNDYEHLDELSRHI